MKLRPGSLQELLEVPTQVAESRGTQGIRAVRDQSVWQRPYDVYRLGRPHESIRYGFKVIAQA